MLNLRIFGHNLSFIVNNAVGLRASQVISEKYEGNKQFGIFFVIKIEKKCIKVSVGNVGLHKIQA